jgi:hypothetical protein
MNPYYEFQDHAVVANYKTVVPFTARKRPVPGDSGDVVETVFRPEIFRSLSNAFPSVLAGKHRKLAGIHRKKFGNFPAGIIDQGCFEFITNLKVKR